MSGSYLGTGTPIYMEDLLDDLEFENNPKMSSELGQDGDKAAIETSE